MGVFGTPHTGARGDVSAGGRGHIASNITINLSFYFHCDFSLYAQTLELLIQAFFFPSLF